MLEGRILYGLMNLISTVLGYGFFLQMFPEKRGKDIFSKILFLIVVCVAIGAQTLTGQFYYIFPQGILIYPIIHGVVLTMFYKCRYPSAFVWMWFYSVIIEVLKLPLLTCEQIWWRQNNLQLDIGSWIGFEAVWYLAIVILISWIQRTGGKMIRDNLKEILEEKTMMLFGFAVLEWSMLMVIVYNEQRIVSVGNLVLNLIVFGTAGVLFWQMYHSVCRVKQVEQELVRQQRVWLREQKAMKDNYVKDAKRMHDMKHVLLYLQKCLAEKDTEKAEEYLKKYTEEVVKSQRKIWTGFSEIDFSVNYYYQMMQEKGIRFSIETDVHDIPIEELDLMIIFGNLLDNAMTAAEKCEPEERCVHLKLQTVNEMFLLQMENSTTQMPEKKNGRFLSSKAEREHHGWGIENVKQIVERYDGDIQFAYTEKEFKAEILIYGENGKE